MTACRIKTLADDYVILGEDQFESLYVIDEIPAMCDSAIYERNAVVVDRLM